MLFSSILWFSFLFELFSTLLKLHCQKCLFHINIHIDLSCKWHVCGKSFKVKCYIKKQLAKTNRVFLVSSWRFQHSMQLLQNPKLLLMTSFPNNHYCAYIFLRTYAQKWNVMKANMFFKSWFWNIWEHCGKSVVIIAGVLVERQIYLTELILKVFLRLLKIIW